MSTETYADPRTLKPSLLAPGRLSPGFKFSPLGYKWRRYQVPETAILQAAESKSMQTRTLYILLEIPNAGFKEGLTR